MSNTFDYTAFAQRFSARFPVASFVSIQMSFWVVANVLLALLTHLNFLVVARTHLLPATPRLGPTLAIALVVGILYGLVLGLADYYLDKTICRAKSLGRVVLLKAFVSAGVLILLFLLIQTVLFRHFHRPSLFTGVFMPSRQSWEYLFYASALYYFFMTLVISFINQVNKKYGAGVLLPLLLGKYRKPREEERIFLFMDLKSSTSLAEELGHLKYSAFIRDAFLDINHLLLGFRGEVYQYAGDEVIVTWRMKAGLKDLACIHFFFACEEELRRRADHYIMQYGTVPQFKAGLHAGAVTAVEIGDVKRDIAYHGDTLNTAARIQGVCNDFGRTFLLSETLYRQMGPAPGLTFDVLGSVRLKGKANGIGIVGVERVGREVAEPVD